MGILAFRRQNCRFRELGAHKSRHPQNSKSLPAKSNSSKSGLTIRGMFNPSGRPLRRCAQPAEPRRLTVPHCRTVRSRTAAERFCGQGDKRVALLNP
jgi:hypothetical protein